MYTHTAIRIDTAIANKLSQYAVESLLEELTLTPKPGLVDGYDNGCHHDLSLSLMQRSATSLRDAFYQMALAAAHQQPSWALREQLGAIGRQGEQTMLEATGQVNTHKGAIWAVGLLVGSASILLSQQASSGISAPHLLDTAGAIARYTDRYAPASVTNGARMRSRYQVRSAREEAAAGFPTIRQAALPAWDRFAAEDADLRKLNVFISLMAVVQDTCILHRSNMSVLLMIQGMAQHIVRNGGLHTKASWPAYGRLADYIKRHWVSPGGSADLLAATIFIQKIIANNKMD